MPVERAASGVFRLTPQQVDDLARELGVTPPVPGLSRAETKVLAALSRSPRGVASVREAGRRAGVSPAATARALARLSHHGSVDLDELTRRLPAAGPFAVTGRAPGTLSGVFSAAKVQFLHADEGCPQHLLEPPHGVGGLRVAQLSDLMAMKLQGGRRGPGAVRRAVPARVPAQQAISHILLGPGYLDDAGPGDALPVPRAGIAGYWTRRQREIVAARGRLPTWTSPQAKPRQPSSAGNLCSYRRHGGVSTHSQICP